jgi:hypothetical protein
MISTLAERSSELGKSRSRLIAEAQQTDPLRTLKVRRRA